MIHISRSATILLLLILYWKIPQSKSWIFICIERCIHKLQKFNWFFIRVNLAFYSFSLIILKCHYICIWKTASHRVIRYPSINSSSNRDTKKQLGRYMTQICVYWRSSITSFSTLWRRTENIQKEKGRFFKLDKTWEIKENVRIKGRFKVITVF